MYELVFNLKAQATGNGSIQQGLLSKFGKFDRVHVVSLKTREQPGGCTGLGLDGHQQGTAVALRRSVLRVPCLMPCLALAQRSVEIVEVVERWYFGPE